MKRVVDVFADLALQGFLTRTNFSCCNNCAGSELATIATEMLDAGTDKEAIKGCAFWHKQAQDAFDESGSVYIGFGQLHTVKYGDIGWPSVQVGHAVVAALRAEGYTVEWDGTDGTKILLHAPDDPLRRERGYDQEDEADEEDEDR